MKYTKQTFLLAAIAALAGCANPYEAALRPNYVSFAPDRPPKPADCRPWMWHPEQVARVSDTLLLIGSLSFPASAVRSPEEMVAKMEEVARAHGADIWTLDSGADLEFNTGIYIPSRTTYNPVPVTNTGQVTVTNPYGYASTGTYTSTQTQYVPHTTEGVDTRRVVHIPTFTVKFYAMTEEAKAKARESAEGRAMLRKLALD